MNPFIITGVLMFVVGLFLTKVPIFRIAVGPILYITGGVICLIGVFIKE